MDLLHIDTPLMMTILDHTNIIFIHREITFENAEELTEEGLPFLILFHAQNDTESLKSYKTIVENQLLSEKRMYRNISITKIT